MAEVQRDTLVSRNSATTVQNIPFENYSPGPIVCHYLRGNTFSRFHTISECDRHTRADKQMDGQIHDDGMHSVAR